MAATQASAFIAPLICWSLKNIPLCLPKGLDTYSLCSLVGFFKIIIYSLEQVHIFFVAFKTPKHQHLAPLVTLIEKKSNCSL